MSLSKYSLLSFPIASFGLGVWQIKRLEWKKGVIANLESKIHADPIDILNIESISELCNFEYQPVKARGHFDENPDNQIYLKPRQLLLNKEAILRGRTENQSKIGVNVVTPFTVDGTNLRILVNRGWLAMKGVDSVQNSAHIGLKSENDSDKPIELVGILRLTDNRPSYGAKNNKFSNEWQFRDVEAMAKVLKTAPIYLDADQNLSHGKGPIGGQTQVHVRNEHLNYAITWFSLSALSYLMWYSKYGKRAKVFFSKPKL